MNQTQPISECLDIALDKSSRVSLQSQLYQAIRQRILDGRFQVSQRLPASRQLAEQLCVSRNTVQQSLDQLLAEGYIVSKRGSGVYINTEIPDSYHQLSDTSVKPKHLQQSAISEYQNTAALQAKPFTPGLPDMQAFPRNIWRQLWHKHLRTNPYVLSADNTISGCTALKTAVHDYLRYARGVQCDFDQIIITNGAAQALDLITRLLLNPTDNVILEEPGYIGARRLLQHSRANIIPCMTDDQGIDIESVSHSSKVMKLLYCTPTHQYPLGSVMPITRRLRLLDWANQANSLIIEDDYDSEFQYCSKPLPSLHSLDGNNRVIYVGSFSKVLDPFLRLGYMVVPKHLIQDFCELKWAINGCTDPIKQMVVANFMQQGHFARHLKRMRMLYRQKLHYFTRLCERTLSPQINIHKQTAGMHLVVSFSQSTNDQALVSILNRHGYGCKALSTYYHGTNTNSGLVMGFSHMSDRELELHTTRLAEHINGDIYQ